MKRKLMLGLLSAVGGLTIIGSGFSAWYFGDNNIVASSSINAKVTDLATKFGIITPTDVTGVVLELDQGGYKNKTDDYKGISFTKDGAIYDEKIGASYHIDATDSINAMNAGLKATFNCVVTLKTGFATYLEFKPGFYRDSAFTVIVDGAGNKSFTVSKDITFVNGEVNSKFEFDITSYGDHTNNAFKYVKDKKPTDIDSYNALHKLDPKNVLTFTYSLDVFKK